MTTCVLTVGSRNTRPKWYIELDPEASSTKCRIFPCQINERYSPNAVLPTSMVTRQRDFTLKPGKYPGLTLSYRPISLLDTVC